jgi:formylglycine-generating enzyme required for sulfatase activity
MSKRRLALFRLVPALAAVLLFLTAIPSFGQNGARHALVIGNSNYRSNTVSILVNPVNDARDVAATLRQMGFSVREIIDGSREQMALAIDGFSRDLKGAEVGLFFFAGHGVQVDGRNYLIPVDAELPNSQVVPFRTIVADEVLAGMSAAGAKLNLFFLDACRDNPLPAESRNLQRGLAVVGNRPPETMIVYATQANATAADGTGRNSPFTQALLKHLPVPALDVYDLFRNVSSEVQGTTGGRQRPEQFGNVTVRYSLASGSLGSAAVGAPSAPTAPTPSFGIVSLASGSLSITVASAATVSLLDKSVELPAGATLPVNNVTVGDVAVAVRYADGKTENRSVRVEANRSVSVSFDYRPVTTGSLRVSAATAGTVWLDGSQRGTVSPGGSLTLSDVPAGSRRVEIRYADGKSETSTATVSAGGAAVAVAFSYQPAPATAFDGLPHAVTAGQSWTSPSGIKFMVVPGGSFAMGSPSSGDSDERPVRQVTLTGFWLAATEVTQGQWQAVMGSNPSDTGRGIGSNNPVNNVSWNDAVIFCNKLSQKEGLQPAYTINGTSVSLNSAANGYRLPTEAQWEYAAKGGEAGVRQNVAYSGSNDANAVAWYSSNSGSKTQPVATKAPNALGLYDMSGNVNEWVWDWKDTYPSTTQTDPAGPASGGRRVNRGGSWFSNATSLRPAYRDGGGPDDRISRLGFRLARLPISFNNPQTPTTATNSRSDELRARIESVSGIVNFTIGRQYAVIIGIDKYDEWPSLRIAGNDARSLKRVLADRYYFDEFIELYDEAASANDIRKLFLEVLPRKTNPNDSILIFYAGYGYLDKNSSGFWISYDGSSNINSQNNWIPNLQIQNYISALKAKRVLLLDDAFFSNDSSDMSLIDSKFGQSLVATLESNTDSILTVMDLYARLRKMDIKSPILGTLPGSEEGSNFPFLLKSSIDAEKVVKVGGNIFNTDYYQYALTKSGRWVLTIENSRMLYIKK